MADEGAAIEAKRRAGIDANFADRAEFVQAISFEISLIELASLIIMHQPGFSGFDCSILGLLADVKQRFLKPGAAMVSSPSI